ncbi:hypothetical protein K505DRAFT_325454 [Melanomma pulvis-pyrius CBS 109.77]|uniref:FHA domain-containing protein n=1 Tax=Melanomma pulvis-pyrius CBS 109.77 TaxID=1314802 RepID=A0A6A6XAK4_9PLEO|nr:hypothetical protein K505DRAFT_325454 [Melanomma pulvis-pyrius CBS 109.77]
MPPADRVIEVTLRSIDGLDDFPERSFVLGPNTSVAVGRSSKNTTKKLMSGPDNAFIDSPVISREHALLSANTATGIPAVYITDNGSMHGTFVNSHQLPPKQEHKLHNGDTLQFGMNVVRDQDSFVAKKYRFQSKIAPAIIRGFSVPDMDSSEEEDVEEEDVARTTRYGSQSNPVNLDDFEDMPPAVIVLDEEEPEINKSVPEKPSSPPRLARMYFSDEPSTKESEAPTNSARPYAEDHSLEDEGFMESNEGAEPRQMNPFDLGPESLSSPDEEDRSSQFSEDDVDVESQEEDNLSNMGEDGSISNSEAEADSEAEESEAEDVDVVRRLKLVAMIQHETQKQVYDGGPSAPTPAPRPPFAPAMSSPHTAQASTKYHDVFLSSPPLNFGNTVSPKEVEKAAETAPKFPFSDDFGHASWESMSQFPPRPVAPKPTIWVTPGAGFDSTYLRGEMNHNNHWFDNAPITGGYSPDFRPTKMDYLGQVLNSEPAPAMSIPTPPIPTSNDVNPITPQANRRTKVSIPEIVEDTQQQPPTPTSVGSPKALKRKAEVLDEDPTEATEEPPASVVEGTVATEVVQAAVEGPPAKRNRPTLTNVASFIAGGMFAMGALVMLPDIAFS